MEIVRTIKDMQALSDSLRIAGKSIGYVPTMGFLHEGHLRLVNEAKKNNDIVVMSIFVNPLQFGPNEDFERYPRDFKRDEQLAKNSGVQYIFYPDSNEMYPNPLSNSIVVKNRIHVLCGESRPGHFDGVATVVMKLFHIIMPHRAYFGLKDAQQVAVVQAMVKDFNVPVEIVPVDIVREEDGLAKSSRNVNLTENEREEAPHIYKTLLSAEKLILAGEHNIAHLKEMMKDKINETTSGKIDYVEILSYPELEQKDYVEGTVIIAVAVQFSKARLIDNVIISI